MEATTAVKPILSISALMLFEKFHDTGKGDSRDSQQWDPLLVSFPYHSHIFRDSYGSGISMY